MQKWLKILLTIVAIILVIYCVSGVIMGCVADHLCRNQCMWEGAMAYDVHHSGNFKIDDTCVCFYEEGSKSFRLGS